MLVAEVGNPEEGENLPLGASSKQGPEDVTVDNSVFVMVSCKLKSRAVSKFATNESPAYGHTTSRDINLCQF
jgi:hypothetical protein